jgi:drug/metabolite transporter (DMT)-like permease
MVSTRMKGIAMASAGALFWGMSGLAGQFLLSDKAFSPSQLTDIRLLAAGILLLLCDAFLFHQDLSAVWRKGKDRRDLFFFGALGLLSTQYTYFAAIKYSNAPTATILQYLVPIVIISWVCLTQRRLPCRRELICIILAFAGTVCLATRGEWSTIAISPEALFFGISSAFAAALYTLLPRRILSLYPATTVIGWGLLIGGLVFLPFAQPWHFTGLWDGASLAAFLFVVIAGTILSFCLYLSSMSYISPVEMSILASIEPLSSIVLGSLLFGIQFSFPELLGMGTILLAVLAVSIHR